MALLLFVTVAQLRAANRGRELAGAGALILDNPLGKANYVLFLELQRRVAAAAGVQLVFLTGVADMKAVGLFPNVVRMRNAPDQVGDAATSRSIDRDIARGDEIARVDATRVYRARRRALPVACLTWRPLSRAGRLADRSRRPRRPRRRSRSCARRITTPTSRSRAHRMPATGWPHVVDELAAAGVVILPVQATRLGSRRSCRPCRAGCSAPVDPTRSPRPESAVSPGTRRSAGLPASAGRATRGACCAR